MSEGETLTQENGGRIASAFRRAPRAAAIAVAALGSLALLGWQVDSPFLMGVFPGLVAMNPATAVCFILSGLALAGLWRGSAGRRSLRIWRACAAIVALVGGLKLAGIMTGWDTRIDQILFTEKLDAHGAVNPNRMAPNTALNFLLIGIALWMLSGERRDGRRPSKHIALLAALLSLFALTGYAYGVRPFYGLSAFIPMALNTALAFLLVSTGVLLTDPERGLTRVFASADLGGTLARRLFPLSVGVLLLLGWLRLQSDRLGLLGGELGVSLAVFVGSMLMGGVIWVSAHHLSRSDAERHRAATALRAAHDDLELRVRERTEELRRSEASYRTLVENAPDCIFGVSANGALETVNPAFERATGWACEDWIGRPFASLIHPEDLPRVEEMLRLVAMGDAHPSLECRVKTQSGGWTRWEATISPPTADAPGRLLGVARDITERRRLEDELRHAQKMEAVGRLAGGVAHDFNNLLTAIMGYTQLLAARAQPGDPMLHDAEEILKAATRASTLTRQLLTLSRREMVQPRILDLNALVADLGKMLRRLVGEDVEMVIAASENRVAVKADPGQIEQVVMNLVVNARDAMPDGGRITIETSAVDLDAGFACEDLGLQPGPYVLLAVSDTGMGMDEATKARIFEPFFTTKEAGKGTGLGLSIVYGIVQQCGGTVHVYSDPGWGTTFKIYLPAAAGPVDAGRSADTLEDAPRGSETVLVVEDQEAVGAVLRGALASCGYRVLDARHGLDAIRACEERSEPIHLLITDVVLPMIGGPELAQRVRAIRPGIRVLYVSGYTERAFDYHEAIGGSAAFLPKPFTPGALARKVREVLDAELVSS